MLGAWALLLHNYAGEDHVVFGVGAVDPLPGRDRPLFEAPRTETEAALARIWTDVLRLTDIASLAARLEAQLFSRAGNGGIAHAAVGGQREEIVL